MAHRFLLRNTAATLCTAMESSAGHSLVAAECCCSGRSFSSESTPKESKDDKGAAKLKPRGILHFFLPGPKLEDKGAMSA